MSLGGLTTSRVEMDHHSTWGLGLAHIITCNTIMCKTTHDTGSESTVAQMVRLRFGLELKFKPQSEFSLLFFFSFLFCWGYVWG